MRLLLSRIAAVLVLGMALASCTQHVTPNPEPQSGKPNIVFILTDDLSNNLVRYMPHVLEMQKAGTSFSHYYVVDSLCCPSRAAIFSGEYPHNTGVVLNGGPDGGYNSYQRHDDATKSFALTLQKAGYTTGFMGKYLNGYQPNDPIPPGWNEWDVAGNGYPEFNYTLNENGKQQAYGSSPQDYLTDVLSGKAASFISSTASAHKPFMLEVATFAPHAPYTPAPRYANTDRGVQIPRTPAWDAALTHPVKWEQNHPPLDRVATNGLERQYRLRVEADLATDDLIANVEKTLASAGVANNTYLIFSSDNGYHMGEYRLHAGKQTAFDTDINVPLVITGPDVPRGSTDDRMTSSIDLAPTFEQIAGESAPSTVDGVSMLDLWHGKDPSQWQQAILIEHHQDLNVPNDPDAQRFQSGDPPSYEALRTADALYVRYDDGEVEYFDTAKDPYELNNLASEVPQSMVQTLAAVEKCSGAESCQRPMLGP